MLTLYELIEKTNERRDLFSGSPNQQPSVKRSRSRSAARKDRNSFSAVQFIPASDGSKEHHFSTDQSVRWAKTWVAIARALAMKPEVMQLSEGYLQEPTLGDEGIRMQKDLAEPFTLLEEIQAADLTIGAQGGSIQFEMASQLTAATNVKTGYRLSGFKRRGH